MSRYFAPSTNNFKIESSFVIRGVNHERSNHAYILTGGLDFTWCLGLNEHLALALWLGDGLSWCYLEQLACSSALDTNRNYHIEIMRNGSALIFRLDGNVILDITLDDDFVFPGSHLYKNGFKLIPSKWDIETNIINNQVILPEQPNFGHEIDLISFFYGKTYCDIFAKFLLPSLLQQTNIPDLLMERKVNHTIYCQDDDYQHIKAALNDYATSGVNIEVDTKTLEQASSSSKQYLNLPVQASILRSFNEGSIVVMAQPDHIFGHGLKTAIDGMKPYDYVVCGHPRVDLQGITNNYSIFPGFSSNSELVDFSMRQHPHPMVKHGLVHQEKYWHCVEKEELYVTLFKEPPPLCFHGSPDMISVMNGDVRYSPFESIDHELVDYMYQENRLRVIDDSNVFFWCELTNNQVYNPTIRNDYVSTASQMLMQHPLKWHKPI